MIISIRVGAEAIAAAEAADEAVLAVRVRVAHSCKRPVAIVRSLMRAARGARLWGHREHVISVTTLPTRDDVAPGQKAA